MARSQRRRKRKGMKKRYLCLLTFSITLFALIVGMVYFGVAPFGDRTLLIIDGLHQYMPFYSVLYDKLKSADSLFYSFRSGLGINFLSLFSYYLASPFNLLIVLFPKTQLNAVVSCLIVLKLALSGFFASLYFSCKSKEPDLHIIALGVAYALNGYMVGYCWNVMWIDGIMILPLILLGIEKLIEDKDGRMYCLALFYALYCNYYIGFMICIFCVIWFLLGHFKSIRHFLRSGLSFAFYSVLAGGMSAVLLIPAYMGIKATASGNDMTAFKHSWLTNFWDMIGKQFALGYPITHDNFDGNANLYFGIFTVLFVFLYLLNRDIKILDKIKKILLIVFFYLSFNEEILNYIWHGFHNQYGIPNRFAFLYGFVLLTMVFEVIENDQRMGSWEPILAFLASDGLLYLVWMYADEELELGIMCASILILFGYAAILFVFCKDKKHRKQYRAILTLVMAGEMIVTAMLGFDTNGQVTISKFFDTTEEMETATKELDDGTFYRSELADNKIVDESTWYNMNAISLFGSTARAGTVDIMDSLGFVTGCNEYLYKGANPVTNLMLGVRYLYFHDEDTLKTEFEHVKDYDTMHVYENPTKGLSVAYAISQDIKDWSYTSAYPFRVLNDFCQKGYGVYGVFDNIPIEDPVTNGCTVNNTNDGEYCFNYVNQEDDNLIFQLEMKETCDNLYLFYDGTQVDNVDISIDGNYVNGGQLDGRMIPIGAVDQGSVISMSMRLKGESDTGYIRVSAADLKGEAYKQLAERMTSQALKVTEHSSRHIEGTIDMVEEAYLYFSIPYDSGWKIQVDGKNVETSSIGNAFLSVIIPKGEHEVSLTYTPDGFLVGLAISGISVILFILLSIVITFRKIVQRSRSRRRRRTGGKKYGEAKLESGNKSRSIAADSGSGNDGPASANS